MEHQVEEDFMIKRKQMQADIQSGRRAIESALLLVYIRPRSLTVEDEAEADDLIVLLKKYNKWMAQYEIPKLDASAANDEHADLGGSN